MTPEQQQTIDKLTRLDFGLSGPCWGEADGSEYLDGFDVGKIREAIEALRQDNDRLRKTLETEKGCIW